MKLIARLLTMTAGLIGLAMISAPAHAQQADYTINLTVDAQGLEADIQNLTVGCFLCRNNATNDACRVGGSNGGMIGSTFLTIPTNGASSVVENVTLQVNVDTGTRVAREDVTHYECELTGAGDPSADSTPVLFLTGPLNQ